MKSKISFFNRGISRNLLRRCWPLWVCYALVLMIYLSVVNLGWLYDSSDIGASTNLSVLSSVGVMLFFDAVIALLTVRFLFGFLFEKRGSGMMASLPVRRESVFFTVWLTGLLPTLALNLTWILLVYLTMASLGLSFSTLCVWMLATTCGLLCFYGLAVFCAMLTGSRVIFPLLYLALNFAAVLLEQWVQEILDTLVYGFAKQDGWLFWLSPSIGMIKAVEAQSLPSPHLEGLGVLVAYGAAGLLLAGLALLLYRKRHMESATDNIAAGWLRPVFKYALSISCAFFAATVIFNLLTLGGYWGAVDAGFIAFLLPIGAFIGYFAAEMLLHKSVKVFRGHWKGFAAVSAALLLFFCCAEFSLLGFEKRVPDPQDVEKVTIQWGYNKSVELSQPESLELVRQAHRAFADHKECNDWNASSNIQLIYTMKNGRTLVREYPGSLLTVKSKDNREELQAMEAALSCDEAQEAFFAATIPPEGPRDGVIWIRSYQGGNLESSRKIELLRPEYMDLYKAMQADIQEHTLGRVWLLEDGGLELRTNVEICLQYDERYYWVVCTDSENCLRWLQENKRIVPIPLGEAMRKGGYVPYGDNG